MARCAQFDQTESDFLQLIDNTVAEVPSIIDDLLARGHWRSVEYAGGL
jgi:hypothetical protein